MDVLENTSGLDCRGPYIDEEGEQRVVRGQEGDLGHAGANGSEEGGHET